jgi:3-oxoacyl-[acyl-carrier protein] reductase
MRLKGKVAVVTGAGSGLGRAIALQLAEEGADIVVATLNTIRGEQTAQLIERRGAKALAITTDVSRSSAVADLFKGIDAEGWRVDILINNAGNAGPLVPAHEITDAQWNSRLAVHLNGTFYCTREALKRMLVRKAGVILNISSVAGLRGLRGDASYTAAKGAIIAFTKGVAQEVAPHGIRVNCLAPGLIETGMLENFPPETRAMMIKLTPQGRLGTPEEIAKQAAFLVSDEGSFTVGQTISPN